MEYVAERKATKTYQENLILFKEYKIERKWGGLMPVFPDLPKADNEHHVLVLNFKGIFPSIIDILTQQKPEIGSILKTNELGQYLFVLIKIKPKLLSIPSPNGGYQLGDGHAINAALDITYQIKDVKEFWLSADDPMAMFQRAVINEARKYFFSITSEYLIRRPGDSKGDFESYIREHRNNDSETRKIKDSLEKDIKAGCASSGIEITKVYADIQLSQSLSEHLQRLHERIYKQGGIHESYYSLHETALRRKHVDEVISNDQTFHPFNLKQVIIALDIGLMENFYNQSLTEAMQKVHDEIRRKKNSYLSDHKKIKIQGIRDLIHIAKEEKFEPEDILKLQDKLLREMTIDQEHDSPLFSDKQFLQLVMTQQVESDISKKKTGQ